MAKKQHSPRIIPRAEHTLSRRDIPPNVLKVLYHLDSHGYDAYLVGGCVRDLLLNHHPKDFDVATNAKPEEVYQIFRNCRLIGRRFRLAHIFFGREIVEVATFRGHHATESSSEGHAHDSGLILRDNVYGTIEEDAIRRDFTINALYYNIKDFSLVDFQHGVDDLHNRKLVIMGDAATRYREDPVRMLRAIRFVGKLDMVMSPKTAKPIESLAYLLRQIAPARLFDEIVKLFHTGYAEKVYKTLRQHHLFEILFPHTHLLLTGENKEHWETFLETAYKDTDARIKQDKSVSCAYLFAFLLWGVAQKNYMLLVEEMPQTVAMHEAGRVTLKDQQSITALPRRFTNDVIEIWHLQWRFTRRTPKIVWRTLASPRFRAGFDLLLLRSKADPSLKDLVDWWQTIQTVDRPGQEALIESVKKRSK